MDIGCVALGINGTILLVSKDSAVGHQVYVVIHTID